MSTFIWIIVIGVGIYIASFAFKAAVGLSLPPEETGRAYIKQELKKYGFNLGKIPDACIDDIVSVAINSAKFQTFGGGAFNVAFIESLDAMVDVFNEWVHDPNSPNFQSFDEEGSIYANIFNKHNISHEIKT